MTEGLADISSRIDGVRQLGSVVNAIKGIAAARARGARRGLVAVDSYAATIAAAMASVVPSDRTVPAPDVPEKTGILAFCAEQGFAGVFNARVLDAIADGPGADALLLVGTRGLSVAQARGIVPIWSGRMPSGITGIPRLAAGIVEAALGVFDSGRLQRLDIVHTAVDSGQLGVVRKPLFPLDPADFPAAQAEPPLIQLPAEELVESLGAEYLHARVCRAAIHALVAENEARMQTMAAAGNQIERRLNALVATQRQVRQEQITSEIIELGSGKTRRRPGRDISD
ncbi:F0F1 ATP synthase subunit gamma [Roseisalinus antarcticus]|uniref:ATP synthase gamma chain n=1 Tax=Roseisalinus antarcticus TaxID=254357 RepID=A0A1Y5RUX0_9RHOB|nr:F0F1 ATP synthase subunit gamma [Roseisalinus antarcticus]SLN25707.1 ATP synthase gamma chain [Roseisalinus antarcticus]